MFVLVRNEDGKYVNKPGSERAYTTKLEQARKFPTRHDAERDKCGNETARDVADILRQFWGA